MLYELDEVANEEMYKDRIKTDPGDSRNSAAGATSFELKATEVERPLDDHSKVPFPVEQAEHQQTIAPPDRVEPLYEEEAGIPHERTDRKESDGKRGGDGDDGRRVEVKVISKITESYPKVEEVMVRGEAFKEMDTRTQMKFLDEKSPKVMREQQEAQLFWASRTSPLATSSLRSLSPPGWGTRTKARSSGSTLPTSSPSGVYESGWRRLHENVFQEQDQQRSGGRDMQSTKTTQRWEAIPREFFVTTERDKTLHQKEVRLEIKEEGLRKREEELKRREIEVAQEERKWQGQKASTEKAIALQKKEGDLKAREEALHAKEIELEMLMAAHQKSAILFKLRSILLDVTTRTYRQLLRCVGVDAQIMLDVFQLLLDTGDFPDRGQLIVAMRRLSAKAQIYPQRYILDGPIRLVKEYPVNSGRYADIYQAEFRGITTCLKVIRAHAPYLVQHMAKIYAREAILWGQLSHPNLLPFYGLCMFRAQVAFVAPWAENGNLSDFLAKEPHANRVLLCSDTAAGVEYLHANDVVHGDLKALNILVDASGRACLSDFGLSGITDKDIVRWATQSSAASKGGTARWQAPELHNPEVSDMRNTKASDVFAWASTCYEAFTGNPPYFEIPRETTVAFMIIRGDLPTRPAVEDPSWTEQGLTEGIWDLLEDCWKTSASDRPNISTVITRLDREKPAVDPRPPGQWKSSVAMEFRNADAEKRRPALTDLDVILTRVMDQSTRPLDLYSGNDPDIGD